MLNRSRARRPLGALDFGAHTMTLAFGPFGVQELLLVLVILVLMFGATKLPQIGRGIGEGIRNLKSGLKSDDEQARLDEQRAEEKSRTA
jgi:sec-independent protein translocase protein TatA